MKSSKSVTQTIAPQPCPCESGKPYSTCCQPYHQGLAAPTAEALMRSRYTAFALELESYLLNTWHPDTRPTALNLADDPPTKWLGLQVKHSTNTEPTKAAVEFVARYKVAGKAYRLHELSQFINIGSRWYYLTGRMLSTN
ncbi:MAG: YchJ family protein [Methylotenera sp.]|nr:YchJ family protein [Methylotenera sp.]